MTTAKTHAAHSRYLVLAILCLGLAGLFGWELAHRFDWGMLLFLAITLGLAVWYASVMASRVTLHPDRVEVFAPLGGTQAIEFRQLLSVTEEGRFGRAILLSYHPLLDQGLLDLEDVRTLALPIVVGQDALLADLAKQVPA
jgi:hypothetical protein